MTLHVRYDHQCDACEAHYIPYDEDVPCPKCGVMESERFDYIPQAVESLRHNKERYGTYVPAGWYVSSLADHILYFLFELFDAYEEASPDQDFESFAGEYLSLLNWQTQEYLEHHVKNIAVRIRNVLDQGEKRG